jgi:hypothetical protein
MPKGVKFQAPLTLAQACGLWMPKAYAQLAWAKTKQQWLT